MSIAYHLCPIRWVKMIGYFCAGDPSLDFGYGEPTHPSWLNYASFRRAVTLEILTGMATSVSSGASGTGCRRVEALARWGSVQGAPQASSSSLDAQFPGSQGFLGWYVHRRLCIPARGTIGPASSGRDILPGEPPVLVTGGGVKVCSRGPNPLARC